MNRLTFLAVFVALFVGITGITAARAEQVVPDNMIKELVVSIETMDVEKFTAKADPEFKNRVTRDLLAKVNSQLGPKLKSGYTLEYLGILRQQGTVAYLYKIQFKDGSDDVLARMQLRNGLVSGFLLQ